MDFNQLPRFKIFQFQIVSMISEWAAAYEVETATIERQIAIAHTWILANKKKAPKKDPVRFLNNWMRVTHKMGNLVSKHPDRLFKETAPDENEVMSGDDWARMKEAIRKK